MSYYHFFKNEMLQKEKERYSKEKAAEYFLENKGKSKNGYKNLSKKKKTRLKSIKEKDVSN